MTHSMTGSYLRRGMTLIELMIVVSILGILAAIVVPTITDAREEARITATVTDIRTMAVALHRYHADHGEYPAHTGYRKMPPGLLGYFPQKGYSQTPVGGEWDYTNFNPPQSTISGQKFSVSVRIRPQEKYYLEIDKMLDDGNLRTGAVQQFNAQGKSLVYIVKPE